MAVMTEDIGDVGIVDLSVMWNVMSWVMVKALRILRTIFTEPFTVVVQEWNMKTVVTQTHCYTSIELGCPCRGWPLFDQTTLS